MKALKQILLLGALLVLATPAAAHDQKHHKGKPTEGRITSISADSLEMTIEKGTTVVTIGDHTKLEMGNAKAAITDLKEGMLVKVFGTKMPGGKMAANEILLEEHHEKQKSKEHHDHAGHDHAGHDHAAPHDSSPPE